jgi:acetyl esterase
MTPYELDAELAPLVAAIPGFEANDATHARELLAAFVARQPAYVPPVPLTITDTVVPSDGDGPPVAVRVYEPASRADALPAIVFLHGGGFVAGNLDSEHPDAARLAVEVGALTLSVDYRLAPEHPFPAALEDGYRALEWLVEGTPFAIDRQRVAVRGSSAGGGLAAAMALLARDRGGPRLAFQSLIVPELDDRLETASMQAFLDTPVTTRAHSERSWRQYLPVEPGSADVSIYAAPARASGLSALPPAFVSVSEFDPLRDEGIDYARRLVEAGVHTELHLYPGTIHATPQLAPEAEVSRRIQADEVAALRRALHGAPYARAVVSDAVA